LKSRIILSSLWICLLVSVMVFISCDNLAESVNYPVRDSYIKFLDRKAGLTSSSTNQAFDNARNEILNSFDERYYFSDVYLLDGVIYSLVNVQEISEDDIPQFVWDIFWEKLKKEYYYDIGSCFFFRCLEIPGEKETGQFYRIVSIVQEIGLIRGKYWKGVVDPIR